MSPRTYLYVHVWRIGRALRIPARWLPGFKHLAHFVRTWTESVPRMRTTIAPLVTVEPYYSVFVAAGGVVAGFKLLWSDTLEIQCRSRFADAACPTPGLNEIAGSVLQVASLFVTVDPWLRPPVVVQAQPASIH